MSKAVLFGVIPMLTVALQGWAGTVRPSVVTVEERECQVSVVLSGSESQVTALDFHLVYDPALLEPLSIEPGPAATRAGKMVTANAAEPGRYIVVALGLNQTPMEDGEIAFVGFRRVGEPTEATTTIAVQQPTLASWDGKALPSDGGATTVALPGTKEGEEGEKPDTPETPETRPDTPTRDGNTPANMTRGRLVTLAGQNGAAHPEKAPSPGMTAGPGESASPDTETSQDKPDTVREQVAELRRQLGESPAAVGGLPAKDASRGSQGDDTPEPAGDTGQPRGSLTIERQNLGETVNSTLSGETPPPVSAGREPRRLMGGVLLGAVLAAGAAVLLVLRFRLFR